MQRLLQDSLFSKLLFDEINGFKLTTNTQQSGFTCNYSYEGQIVARCNCALDGVPLSLTIFDMDNQNHIEHFIKSYKLLPYTYVYAVSPIEVSVTNLLKPFTYSGYTGRQLLPLCIKSAAYPRLSIATNFMLELSNNQSLSEIITKIESNMYMFLCAKPDFNIEALKRQCDVFDHVRAIITNNGYENHTGFHPSIGGIDYKIAVVMNLKK